MLIITQIIRSCAITNYITSSILFLLFLHSFSSHSSKDVRLSYIRFQLTVLEANSNVVVELL